MVSQAVVIATGIRSSGSTHHERLGRRAGATDLEATLILKIEEFSYEWKVEP